MFRAFSLKNILWGIFLGLLVVGGWLYYPELSARFGPGIPDSREEAKALIRQQVEKAQPHIEKIASELSEIKATIGSSLPEDEKPAETAPIVESYSAQKEANTPEKEIAPYFAEEESRWQALMKMPFDPDDIRTYPYSECFRQGASQHNLPFPLVIGLAAYLSNFNPVSSIENKFGIMHIGWPDPSEKMGIKKKETLTDEPCLNIELGCRFLSELLDQGDGEWVPALVAFRNQFQTVRRERIALEDLAFSARLRAYVERAYQGPFEKKTMTPFLSFNNQETAEKFMAIVSERAGVDLWLGQKDYLYTVFILAANDLEKENKIMQINEKAGINGKNDQEKKPME